MERLEVDLHKSNKYLSKFQMEVFCDMLILDLNYLVFLIVNLGNILTQFQKFLQWTVKFLPGTYFMASL